MKPNTTILLASGLALLLMLAAAAAPARADCPPYVKTAVGGDYNDAEDRQGLAVVESYHFTPAVENLKHGNKSYLGGDLSYTLEHFPNHHRALSAMAKLVLRDKNVQPTGARFSIECYFQRALDYRPKDAKVHAIYAGFLLAQNKLEQAREQLDIAVQLDPDNATSHYNLGLLHVKQKNYAAARQSAERAYALGFPLPGLRKQLQDAGQWPQ